MSNQLVITISRQFGSGGRQVGVLLSRALHIPCYDKAIIEKAAEESGLAPEYIQRAEAGSQNQFFFNLAMTDYVQTGSFTQYNPVHSTFHAQSRVIKELAQKGNCIIVGRCGNYILRDRPNTVHVFVYGEEEQRLKRAIQDYGLDKDEAKKMLNQVDKGRSNYYRNFTGEKYGQKESFDLMINSSTMGVDGTVNILCSYAQYICADDEL